MKLRCIIVDDEPLACRILQNYLRELPQLQLLATCHSAIEAGRLLQEQSIDLLFLDINMPRLSGTRFLRSLSHPPMVIFVTAYPEYAVEGFELAAIDYLLKPFSFERCFQAVNKAIEHWKGQQRSPQLTGALTIKADKKWYRLEYSDINYLQAFGDYVKIFTAQDRYLTKERLSELERRLPPTLFLRIHRSYLIRLNAVQFVEGNQVKVGKAMLPVAKGHKAALLNQMGNPGNEADRIT
ncbi:MAG: LytTR family DNA-binding domain-containing protein [Bacteroidota bacterium]